MRMNEQIARDAEVARIHAEEELQGMIDSLDMSNETIAKYLQEYQDFALELPLEKRIERRPMTKKQKREYYMAMIINNLGWKVKDFKGLSFEEIKAKFAEVWKQVEDFILMGSKEEAKRLKRKGLNLEQEHVKKQKSSEEAPEMEKSTEEITEEKMKEIMQLVPVEDVYVQAFQVKHPIIDWKPDVTGNQSNGSTYTKACDNVGKARVETVPNIDYKMLPLWTQDPPFSSSLKNSLGARFKPLREEEKKDDEDPMNEDSEVPSIEEPRVNQEKDSNVNITNNINNVSPIDNAAGIEDNDVEENIVYGCANDPNIPDLEEINRFGDAEDDDLGVDRNNLDTNFPISLVPTTRIHKDHPLKQVIKDLHSASQIRRMSKNLEERGLVSSKWVFRNKLDERGNMIRNKARLVAQGHTQKEGINYYEVFAPVARIEAIRLFLAYALFKDFVVYQIDVKSVFLYGKIEEEKPRKPKRQAIEETHPNGLTYEALRKENVPTHSNDPPLLRVNTLGSMEDRLKLKELMELCTKLSDMVLNLETTKTAQAKEISSLKKKSQEIREEKRSGTHGLKRLYKVGLSARVESSVEEESLGEDDASKQERISDIDANQDIYLVNFHRDEDIFGVNDQDDTSMFDAAKDIQGEKTSRPKAKSIVMQEPSETPTTTTTIPISSKVQDKGKGIMVEEPLKMKKKDQISFDEQEARRLQAEINEQDRLEEEEAQKALKANIVPRDLKNKPFAEIKELFDKAMARINNFVDFTTELVKKSIKKDKAEITQESSSKRAADELDQTPIVDYKIYKEGRKSFFQIFRADGNSQMYLTFSKLLKNFDREDLEVLWSIVKTRFENVQPVDHMDSFLMHTLKTMFEHHVEDYVWKNQQGLIKNVDQSVLYNVSTDVDMAYSSKLGNVFMGTMEVHKLSEPIRCRFFPITVCEAARFWVEDTNNENRLREPRQGNRETKRHATYKDLQRRPKDKFVSRAATRYNEHHKAPHNPFTALIKSSTKNCATAEGKSILRPLPKMFTSANKRVRTKYCEFHEDHGHDTNGCIDLRKEIETCVHNGRLSHLANGTKTQTNSQEVVPLGSRNDNRPHIEWNKKDEANGELKSKIHMTFHDQLTMMEPRYSDRLSKEEQFSNEENNEEKIVINEAYPEQKVITGKNLSMRLKQQLFELLRSNIDIFAWTPADMTVIPHELA
nr:retrotransposon Gag domain-containing protein [Tanacetum cinerariifolium]